MNLLALYQNKILKKKEKKEELKNLVTSLVDEEKLSKKRLSEMILEVMKDKNDAKGRSKSVKLLVRTLLKSESLVPRSLDPEQIIHF